MKTKSLFIVAVASLSLFPALLMAQEKGATRLMTLATAPAQPQAAAASRDLQPMACPKCQDTQTVVTTGTAKGTNPAETKTITKHLCPACTTFIKTEGVGKNAKNIPAHTCSNCGSANVACCALSQGGGPTPGM